MSFADFYSKFEDNFDSFMLDKAQKLGNFYQDKAGRNADELKRGLYAASASNFLYSSHISPHLALKYFYPLIAAFPIIHCLSNGKFISTYQSKYSKCINIYIFNTLCGISFLTTGLAHIIINSNQKEKYEATVSITAYGAGMLLWTLADYMNRCKYDPPKKRKKESLSEKFKKLIESLAPNPSPIPAPVESRMLEKLYTMD
ncbi:MAG: hypothetical protein V1870_01595 [Candidatus Aenigmatarchaeota archaeon]